MYDRKIYLYFALAIVGFLFWNAWEADYGPKKQIAPVAVTAPAAPANVATQTNTASPQATASQTIAVNTDTLQLQINTLGGNITSLKLPKYPAAYQTPRYRKLY